MSHVQVVGAAIVDSLASPKKLLAGRRSAPAALAGLWEFPGGKVENNESHEAALLRELHEELGVQVRLGEEIVGPDAELGWPLKPGVSMRVWAVSVQAGTPRALQDHDQLRWLALDDALVGAVPWIPADEVIVEALVEQLGR